MDNFIGKKIEGRYQIGELVGVGGMANVYKATDLSDGKMVAVKVLRKEFYENEELLRRFKNESKAIAMLSHPNIIKVYDVCFAHNMRCIVMEYIDGITLKEYMEEQRPLAWKETVHFVLQILKALSHAHSKGIVHRDIKPQNMMLLSDARIKITDFGIARFARSESHTLTDRAIGSVHYISPEQAKGDHTDQRADIYSIGVMLYEMLTGQLPFDADSPVSVALKQIELEAPSPRSINPEIPEGLEEITMRAMEKDPERRYQSADEMLKDIEAFKQNPSVHFEYQYMTDQKAQSDRFRRNLRHAKQLRDGKGERMAKQRSRKPKEKEAPNPRGNQNYDEEDDPRRGSILMALAGITAAFIVISAAFICAMFYLNNPLEKVPDIVMPDLTGLKYDAIKNAQEYSQFVLEVEDNQYNDLHERGEVVSQKPKAGTKVKENSVVRLIISNGTKVVLMPNLIGLEETLAYQELADLDLQYQKVEIFSQQPAGTVVATDPGFGSEIPASTIVKVQISMGPENKVVEVPDLTGMDMEAARTLLQQLGLEVGGISYITSDKAKNVIISQDPAPTSQIASGAFVNLNVSGGEDSNNQITLHIPLPSDVSDIVKMQAMFDGRILREERLQPDTALFWKPMFEGSGVAKIFILYNDFLYQTYEVDFNTGGCTLVEDNSNMHS
ncbi:MAG: Stk1 family PASTA domain-containing Ser/Thr kinase [Candidatus Fimivivens sp.]